MYKGMNLLVMVFSVPFLLRFFLVLQLHIKNHNRGTPSFYAFLWKTEKHKKIGSTGDCIIYRLISIRCLLSEVKDAMMVAAVAGIKVQCFLPILYNFFSTLRLHSQATNQPTKQTKRNLKLLFKSSKRTRNVRTKRKTIS